MAVEGATVKTGTTGLSIMNVSRRTTRTSTTCGTVARTQWRCRHRIPRPDTSRQWIRAACRGLSDVLRHHGIARVVALAAVIAAGVKPCAGGKTFSESKKG